TPLQMVELGLGNIMNAVAAGPDLEAEVAVLVVADDIVGRKAAHGGEQPGGEHQAGTGDRRNLAADLRRSEVTRQPLEIVVVKPAALVILNEVKPGVLDRMVLIEQLGADGADAPGVEARRQHA